MSRNIQAVLRLLFPSWQDGSQTLHYVRLPRLALGQENILTYAQGSLPLSV